MVNRIYTIGYSGFQLKILWERLNEIARAVRGLDLGYIVAFETLDNLIMLPKTL